MIVILYFVSSIQIDFFNHYTPINNLFDKVMYIVIFPEFLPSFRRDHYHDAWSSQLIFFVPHRNSWSDAGRFNYTLCVILIMQSIVLFFAKGTRRLLSHTVLEYRTSIVLIHPSRMYHWYGLDALLMISCMKGPRLIVLLLLAMTPPHSLPITSSWS